MTDEERIEAERLAIEYYSAHDREDACRRIGFVDGYAAGVSAERARIQPVVDALNQAILKLKALRMELHLSSDLETPSDR